MKSVPSAGEGFSQHCV